MRKIVVLCDPCDQDGKQADGMVVDVAVRMYRPGSPKEDTETVQGTLEICSEHGAPVHAVVELVKQHGALLAREARDLLVKPPLEKGDRVVCHDCTPPKVLKKSSLYTHGKTHDKDYRDLEIREYVPKSAS